MSEAKAVRDEFEEDVDMEPEDDGETGRGVSWPGVVGFLGFWAIVGATLFGVLYGGELIALMRDLLGAGR